MRDRMIRDDFNEATKNKLAKRVGFKCSNPSCRTPTSGPKGDGETLSIGVAAHITAASPEGPRYDSSIPPDTRKSTENGIWLCQTCSRLIDVNPSGFSVELLGTWKQFAEAAAYVELQGFLLTVDRSFAKLEEKTPELFKEMREDLRENIFVREFILMSKSWRYNPDPLAQIFVYYFEDHQNLKEKMKVFCNYNAVIETTYNNVDRYEFTEEFAEYLLGDAASD